MNRDVEQQLTALRQIVAICKRMHQPLMGSDAELQEVILNIQEEATEAVTSYYYENPPQYEKPK